MSRLFHEEDLDFETNAVGVIEYLKTLGPGERVKIQTLFGYEFKGTAQKYEEEEDLIREGDSSYRELTHNNHWRIQEGLFHVRHYDDGTAEVVQEQDPHPYKGKGK